MIECEAFPSRGMVLVQGLVPNGHLVVTRKASGVPDITLRNGVLDVTTGGFTAEDSEAPLGTPLTYRATSTPTSRTIQRNLVPTPNFMHDIQAWAAGTSRTASIVTDATAHHASVGKFTGNPAAAALVAAPTLVGHIESTAYVSGNYTLTPPTGGGTAIATNDWVYLIHQQLGTIAAPAIPSGFTLVSSTTVGTALRTIVWRRKRVGGDTGYTVTVTAGAESLGTLLWVRGAGDDVPFLSDIGTVNPDDPSDAVTPQVTAVNPALIISVVSAQTATADVPPVAVTGGPVWQYTQGTSANTKSVLIATETLSSAGRSSAATVTYPVILSTLTAFQMAVGNATAITNRVIGKAKTTAMSAAVAEPYLFTGRFRFISSDVWLWSDVEAQGTWANLRSTKATWEAVRSSAVPLDVDYARFYVAIVNPATGAYYVPPVQAIGIPPLAANTWIDYSFYFTPNADIPTNSEIWFIQGVELREYLAEWYFDDVGITAGAEWAHHDTLYYMDGDTPKPTDSAARLDTEPGWQTDSDNSTLGWTGTAGNSISLYQSPSTIWAETSCQLDPPTDLALPCGPVMISDPVSSSLAIWVGLLGVDTLAHPSNQQVYRILSRSPAVAVSQMRGWESGGLRVLTTTLEQRTLLVKIMKSGRVLLLRNPDMSYPENNWYLAVGDMVESRIITDARNPLREWSIPFVRVEAPVGSIAVSSGVTWAEVEAMGTWQAVKDTRETWLDLMTAVPV